MHCLRVLIAGVVVGFSAAGGVANEPAPFTPVFIDDAPQHHSATHAGRTVLVPQMVMETREVVCCEERPQLVTKKVPVVKRVPVSCMQQRSTVRMIQKKVPQTVCRQTPAPEDSTASICVTKMVPHTEKLTGMRKVTREVPGVEKRIVCEDLGHWEPCGCTCACATCRGGGCCGRCPHKRWVSNKVERVVEVPVMKTECFEEPYEYEVTRMKPQIVKQQLTLRQYGHAKKVTEEVMVTMLVPECVQETVPVTTCKCYLDYEEKQCTVMVPVKVIKEVQVPVCRMVQMTVPAAQ